MTETTWHDMILEKETGRVKRFEENGMSFIYRFMTPACQKVITCRLFLKCQVFSFLCNQVDSSYATSPTSIFLKVKLLH